MPIAAEVSDMAHGLPVLYVKLQLLEILFFYILGQRPNLLKLK